MAFHCDRADPPLCRQPEAKGKGRVQHNGKTGQAIGAEMGRCKGLPLCVHRDCDWPCAGAEHNLAYGQCHAACHGKALAGKRQNKAEGQGQDRVQWSHRPEV